MQGSHMQQQPPPRRQDRHHHPGGKTDTTTHLFETEKKGPDNTQHRRSKPTV